MKKKLMIRLANEKNTPYLKQKVCHVKNNLVLTAMIKITIKSAITVITLENIEALLMFVI